MTRGTRLLQRPDGIKPDQPVAGYANDSRALRIADAAKRLNNTANLD